MHAYNLLPFSLCQTTWKEKKVAEEKGADAGGELAPPQAGASSSPERPLQADPARAAAASRYRGF